MSDTYRMIAAPAEVEIKIKGSRFIGRAFPATSAEAAEAEIAALRKQYYDATHHCTAYRVGPEGEAFRYNDDGEPASTGGPPILRQIDGRELTNTLVVVTRYYGGTKLGTGGLIRAYGDAASEVLDACRVVEHVRRLPVHLTFAYDDTSPAMHTISRFDAEMGETTYSDHTEMTVHVRRSEAEPFVAAFIDALGGRGEAAVEEMHDA